MRKRKLKEYEDMETERKWRERENGRREKMRKWRENEEITHSILAFVVSIAKMHIFKIFCGSKLIKRI